LGSYRHVTPERHPRRVLRLVNRTERVDWRVCATVEEAVALEAELLREYRPPFNRAGTWQGESWWFRVRAEGNRLGFGLEREGGGSAADAVGPLPSSFRRVFVALARCVARAVHPERGWAEHPAGLINGRGPREWSWEVADASGWAEALRDLARGDGESVARRVAAWPTARSAAEEEFWEGEVERLKRFTGESWSRGAGDSKRLQSADAPLHVAESEPGKEERDDGSRGDPTEARALH
jgi:hypothetical protein